MNWVNKVLTVGRRSRPGQDLGQQSANRRTRHDGATDNVLITGSRCRWQRKVGQQSANRRPGPMVSILLAAECGFLLQMVTCLTWITARTSRLPSTSTT